MSAEERTLDGSCYLASLSNVRHCLFEGFVRNPPAFRSAVIV